jgi:ribonuclease Z
MGPRRELSQQTHVTLTDGRLIDPEDVLGPPERGKKLVIVGDVETTEGLAGRVREADALASSAWC